MLNIIIGDNAYNKILIMPFSISSKQLVCLILRISLIMLMLVKKNSQLTLQ